MLTDKEISNILNDIVYIFDTREQKNHHIIEYFEKNNIPYIIEKLETTDYSYYLPNYPHLNLDKQVLIEKKNSLDEICGNFTKDRDRFAREFERVDNELVHIIIENATWRKLFNHSYNSQLPPKSLLASLLTWNARYDCPIWFCKKDEIAILIQNIIYYNLREILKNT